MAEAIVLPQLGQKMEEATVLSFAVNEGEHVSKGDVVFEVETEKTTLEVESPAEGFVKKILVEVEQIIAVNTMVMVVGAKEEKVSDKIIDSLRKDVERGLLEGRARVTVRGDVDKLDLAEAAFGLGVKIPVNGAQALAAEKALESKREIPCFYLNTSTDVGRVLELCAELSERAGTEVCIEDFIVRAVALGVAEYPVMSGQLSEGFICLADKLCVGLVVGTERGPTGIVIEGADERSVEETARCRGELVAEGGGEFWFENLASACITVSSMGEGGVDLFVPIVMPGQCSILGVGGVKDLCVPVDGDFVIRKSLNLALSVDHRIANGAEAAEFLDYVKKRLGDADSLVR
jgi:pyruvate dehydrogenase E2 component (dihydrolipoamide acetyltransferase)